MSTSSISSSRPGKRAIFQKRVGCWVPSESKYLMPSENRRDRCVFLLPEKARFQKNEKKKKSRRYKIDTSFSRNSKAGGETRIKKRREKKKRSAERFRFRARRRDNDNRSALAKRAGGGGRNRRDVA